MCTTSLEYPRHSMRAKSSHCATPHNVSVLFPERTPNSWPPPRLPPLRSSLTCRSPPAPAGAASLALLRTPPCLCSKNHAAGEGERAGCVGPGRWQRCRTPPAPWKCCQRTRPPPPPPPPPLQAPPLQAPQGCTLCSRLGSEAADPAMSPKLKASLQGAGAKRVGGGLRWRCTAGVLCGSGGMLVPQRQGGGPAPRPVAAHQCCSPPLLQLRCPTLTRGTPLSCEIAKHVPLQPPGWPLTASTACRSGPAARRRRWRCCWSAAPALPQAGRAQPYPAGCCCGSHACSSPRWVRLAAPASAPCGLRRRHRCRCR